MQWACAISSRSDATVALDEASRHLERTLDDTPDLVTLFVTPHFRQDANRIAQGLLDRFDRAVLFGCAASRVIAHEHPERGPGLSLLAGVLPDVELVAFHIPASEIKDPRDSVPLWRNRLGDPRDTHAGLLLLADPLSCDVPRLLAGADFSIPDIVKIGGLASGATRAGDHVFYAGRSVHHAGAVGLAIRGNARLEARVSQCCHPVGHPMFVTRSQDNLVHRLDGRRPSEVLETLYESLDQHHRELLHGALFLGIAFDPARETYEPGQFAIHKVRGLDAESGALALDTAVEHHQIVQFHVRDSQRNSSPLGLFSDGGHTKRVPAAAMLFACRDRGRTIGVSTGEDPEADAPDDAGSLPTAGFFCEGEIGPLAGATRLLTYTHAAAVFQQGDTEPPKKHRKRPPQI